jgi:hypothetical protein
MRYIIVDSREKPKAISSILDYFEHTGIKYEVSKMLFGDYMDYNHPDIVIDRKQNIAELARNCTVEHERFKREMERAQNAGATLYILVEQSTYIDRGEHITVKNIEDLLRWSGKHTIVTGEKVYRVLRSWMAKYPIEVRFCQKQHTGYHILKILYGDKKE